MARHAEAPREYFFRLVETREVEETLNEAYELGFRGLSFEPLDTESETWQSGGERWTIFGRRPLPQTCPSCHRSLLDDCSEAEEGVTEDD